MATRILLICDKCGYEDRLIPGEDPEDYGWSELDGENWCEECMNPDELVEDCNGLKWPRIEVERFNALRAYHRGAKL